MLTNLAVNNPGNKTKIVEEGALPGLIALLNTGSLEAKGNAARALTCLAVNRAKIGGVNLLRFLKQQRPR